MLRLKHTLFVVLLALAVALGSMVGSTPTPAEAGGAAPPSDATPITQPAPAPTPGGSGKWG